MIGKSFQKMRRRLTVDGDEGIDGISASTAPPGEFIQVNKSNQMSQLDADMLGK